MVTPDIHAGGGHGLGMDRRQTGSQHYLAQRMAAVNLDSLLSAVALDNQPVPATPAARAGGGTALAACRHTA